MKALKISILALLMVGGVVAVKAQTVDEIMSKHEKAIGNAAAWNKIKTVKMDGTMSMQGMDIALSQTIVLGKAMRMDISAMGQSFYQIVTQTDGWMFMPGMAKPEPLKAEMLKSSQALLDLKGREMLNYKTNGMKLEFMGKDTLNKVACLKVKCIDKGGNESVSYFDAATYYLLRTESKIKAEEQEQEVTVGYGNYKKMDEGVVMPMTVSANGGEINFKTIELNKTIDESIFKPSEPKAEAKGEGDAKPKN